MFPRNVPNGAGRNGVPERSERRRRLLATNKVVHVRSTEEARGKLDRSKAESDGMLGKTIIVITHNSALAQVADRVTFLRSGEITEDRFNARPIPPEEVVW